MTQPPPRDPDLDPQVARERQRLLRNFLVSVIATCVLGFLAATWVRWPTKKEADFPPPTAQP